VAAVTSAAHRLVLTAAEYAHVVGAMGLSMPPDWAPAPDIATGAEAASLAERDVLVGFEDGRGRVHPSVQANLRVLSGPQIMFDTTATIGARGSRSLHAIAGQYGASLFLLPDAAVELSMFRATDLGRELVRAVPAEEPGGIGSALDGDEAEPLRGRVPLGALHELGVAELLRESDPDVTGHVLGELRLPPDEAAFAVEAVRRTDGVLRCLVVALIGEGVRTAQLSWLHSDTGWVGIRPAPTGADRQLVDLEPVAREDFGVWLAPFVSEALS
jgi:hypothetical protein